MEQLLGHWRPKGPATDKPPSYSYRATSRLYYILFESCRPPFSPPALSRFPAWALNSILWALGSSML